MWKNPKQLSKNVFVKNEATKVSDCHFSYITIVTESSYCYIYRVILVVTSRAILGPQAMTAPIRMVLAW